MDVINDPEYATIHLEIVKTYNRSHVSELTYYVDKFTHNKFRLQFHCIEYVIKM